MTWSDIQTRFYNLTNTNSSSINSANLTSYITPAVDRVVSLINRSDSRWQWDDSNQSDLPIATTNLVSSQQDYSLATSHLTIDRIEVKNSSGNWTELRQIDQQQFKGGLQTALAAYQPTNGTPTEYDVLGSSIFLYPTPNYSQSASLKIYFSRGQLNFSYVTGQFSDSTGSTSSSPGFNILFHDLVPLWAAYDFSIVNSPEITNSLLNSITRKELELYNFYGLRNRDARSRFTVNTNGTQGAISGSLYSWGGDSNK